MKSLSFYDLKCSIKDCHSKIESTLDDYRDEIEDSLEIKQRLDKLFYFPLKKLPVRFDLDEIEMYIEKIFRALDFTDEELKYYNKTQKYNSINKRIIYESLRRLFVEIGAPWDWPGSEANEEQKYVLHNENKSISVYKRDRANLKYMVSF